MNRRGLGGIGPGILHAAIAGAAAPADQRFCTGGRLLEDIQRGAPADAAIDAIFGQRHGAFHKHEIFAPVFLHGAAQGVLGLFAGGGHEGLGIVEGNPVQQNVGHDGMGGADEGFGAAGAFLEVKP